MGTRYRVHTARNSDCNYFSPRMSKYVSKYVARAGMGLPALRYSSGIGELTGVRSRRCFGGEAMHQTFTHQHENATVAWLEAALEHAYFHGQHSTLAYVEAIMEDVVFEEEIADRTASLLG